MRVRGDSDYPLKLLTVLAVAAWIYLLAVPKDLGSTDSGLKAAFALAGYGTQLPPASITFISYGVPLLSILSYLGIVMHRRWAGWLLLVIIVFSLASSVMGGVQVFYGFGAAVSYLLPVLEGAILVMAFSNGRSRQR